MDPNFEVDADNLTEAEQDALSQMVDEGHVHLHVRDSYTLWNALRDHPDVTMAELEPDRRAVFTASERHSV